MNLVAQMTVPALPNPSLMSRLLFEEPLILTGVLIMLAVAGFVVLNTKGKVRNAILAGGLGFLLATGVQVLAVMVETPREKLFKATTALVTATSHADGASLSPMLDGNVRLSNGYKQNLFPADAEVTGRGEVIARVQKYLGERYPLKECAILETQAVVDGPRIGRSQVRVRVVVQEWGLPITSWWKLDWREGKEGWMVTEIQPLDLGLGGLKGR